MSDIEINNQNIFFRIFVNRTDFNIVRRSRTLPLYWTGWAFVRVSHKALFWYSQANSPNNTAWEIFTEYFFDFRFKLVLWEFCNMPYCDILLTPEKKHSCWIVMLFLDILGLSECSEPGHIWGSFFYNGASHRSRWYSWW